MNQSRYPIEFLEKAKPKLENHFQSIGVGFAESLKSESAASQAAKKMERLRMLGGVASAAAISVFLTNLFPLLHAPANWPILLVSMAAFLTSYFLMESASRSLRILQLLSRNKPLQDKFELLASQSDAVNRYRMERMQERRPLRTYDVAQANVLRMKEMQASAEIH